MVKVGIIGAMGFAGEELLKILVKHPYVEITYLADVVCQEDKDIGEIYPLFKGKIKVPCQYPEIKNIISSCQITFLSLPHTVSLLYAGPLIKAGLKVIDLSADFRLRDAVVYREWYQHEHTALDILSEAVYGLPEFYREKIKLARLLANPGCYPTSVLLGCLPLSKTCIFKGGSIVADSKSGFSGAGRAFVEKNKNTIIQNIKPYNVGVHRHTPEMKQELSGFFQRPMEVLFVPNLAPMERGILTSLYLDLEKEITTERVREIYQGFYQSEPFVKVLPAGAYPETKDVCGTNFCHIGVKVHRKRLAIFTVIDNLVKGASGQAVQNMNLMCGFPEPTGL